MDAVFANSSIEDKKAVLSQGEPRDAAIVFDTYRILQRYRACGFPATARLLYCWTLSADCSESSAKVTQGH